jgi:hypothetical protein
MQDKTRSVLQLDLNNEIHRKILNVVAKGIIKLAEPTFYKASTARDEDSAKNALAEGLNQLAQMKQITTDSLGEKVKGEVISAVRAILVNREPGTFIFSASDLDDVARASDLITQAMQCLKTNSNHSDLNWNYISHDIIQLQQAPQPRTNPPIIPSRKGFFDITPKTADRIGMLGIGFIVSELAAAITVFYTSALSPSTREQAALWISNPTIQGVIMAVNIIAFIAAAFYKAIEPSDRGISCP